MYIPEYLPCVAFLFQPKDGWDNNILKFKGIKHNNDLCYWVKCQLISDNKNDARKYINNRTFNCSSCSQCYKFCFRNYFKKDGEYKYIPRLTKRNLASLMSQSK